MFKILQFFTLWLSNRLNTFSDYAHTIVKLILPWSMATLYTHKVTCHLSKLAAVLRIALMTPPHGRQDKRQQVSVVTTLPLSFSQQKDRLFSFNYLLLHHILPLHEINLSHRKEIRKGHTRTHDPTKFYEERIYSSYLLCLWFNLFGASKQFSLIFWMNYKKCFQKYHRMVTISCIKYLCTGVFKWY